MSSEIASGELSQKAAPATRRSTALQAAALLSALYFLAKLTGLVQQQIIMAVLPTGATDAYTAAFRLTDFVNYLVAGGALSVTFIPLFTELRETEREDEGWKFFSTLFWILGVVITVVVTVCIWKAASLMQIFAPGLDGPKHPAGTFRFSR